MLPLLYANESRFRELESKPKNFDLYQSSRSEVSQARHKSSLPKISESDEHDPNEKVKRMIFRALDDFQSEIKSGPNSPKKQQPLVPLASPRPPPIHDIPSESIANSNAEMPVVELPARRKLRKVIRVKGSKKSDRAKLAYILKAISKGMLVNPSTLSKYDLTGVSFLFPLAQSKASLLNPENCREKTWLYLD